MCHVIGLKNQEHGKYIKKLSSGTPLIFLLQNDFMEDQGIYN